MKSIFVASLLILLWTSHEARGRILWEGEDLSADTLQLHSAVKGTLLQSSAPMESSDATASSIFFGRIRVEPEYRRGNLILDLAYDNQLIEDNDPFTTLSVLPGTGTAAFRVYPLGGNIIRNGTGEDFGELDRLLAAYQKEGIQITVGRQAIGWGRATAFSAVDIYSPFTPFQFDREWKRGVDAVRFEGKMTGRTSVEVILAGGPDWDDSALGGRIRGALESYDFEVLLAKRAQDSMWAVTSSAPVSGAEIHSELALFRTPGDFPAAGLFGHTELVPKGVLGVSNNFQAGNGVLASLEYHYSGFGASSATQFNDWYQIQSYRNRMMRGDSQIYGNQAAVLTLDYTLNERWKMGLETLQSFMDTSGAIIPNVTWDFSDNSSFLGTALLPYGEAPAGTGLKSQFGSRAEIFIFQVRIYD